MIFCPMPVSAGINGFASVTADYVQRELSIDELLIMHPSATFLGVVEDDSMQEVGIFNEDVVVIDQHEVARHGDIIICNLNGEISCKLLDTHHRLLISANAAYKPTTINEADDFVIIGVVTRGC
jgi:DNA polymerase V